MSNMSQFHARFITCKKHHTMYWELSSCIHCIKEKEGRTKMSEESEQTLEDKIRTILMSNIVTNYSFNLGNSTELISKLCIEERRMIRHKIAEDMNDMIIYTPEWEYAKELLQWIDCQ